MIPSIAIMAGGASRRMGRDKAMLALGAETMLEQMARVAVATRLPVIVVGREMPEEWSLKEVRFIPDTMPGDGPLAALATAIRYADTDLLALACDMPLVRTETLGWLIDAASKQLLPNGLIVRNMGEVEPLFSIYGKVSLPIIDDLLAMGERSMMSLIESGDFSFIDAPEWVALALRNINTPSEYDGLIDQ